jgi:glycosyltransferase involved in cell wall biosynthesis
VISDAAPLVSIIVPVFNRADSLPAAIASIAAQTFSDWEIIVVDDCSSDRSGQVALDAGLRGKLRVVRHEINRGPSAARNTGILEARGRFVSFLDSDDRWLPEKLRRQVELAASDPDQNSLFCVTQTLVIMGEGRIRIRPERPPAPGEAWSEFLYVADGFAQTNSFFVSRNLAMRIPFRTIVRQHEDNLFFLEAGAIGARYRLIEEPLSIWNHDFRTDRMGLTPHLEQSREFLTQAGGLLTERARMAFEVRYLGPLLFQENPANAIKLFVRAVISGAVRPSHLLGVAARYALSARTVDSLRRLHYKAPA